jgi:hypothetical protein
VICPAGAGPSWALEAITTALDPARCDRQQRLPLDEAPKSLARGEALSATAGRRRQLMNRLVTSRPLSASRQLGSVEITAGWYY